MDSRLDMFLKGEVMKRDISDYSLRYTGLGYVWMQNDSLLGKMFTKDKFDSKISTILRNPASSEFLIKGLKSWYLPTSSVKVNCIQGQPFDTYAMLSPQKNTLIWCEIHVNSLPSPKVLIKERVGNTESCPANYYLIELLPGLKLHAISPPQCEPFTVNRNDYGAAIIATRFETHKYSDHSHKSGEKESGMLISAASEGEGKYLDDVLFHGEIVDLKGFDFYGSPIWEVECKLDFGNKGELTLPIFISTQQDPEDPLKKGVYIIGQGSLQLFQILETGPEKINQDNFSAKIANKSDSTLCNRKPWWRFWKNEKPPFPQREKETQEDSTGLKVGGIYSVIQGNRKFRIAKLLVLEEGIVHIRIYKNKFNKRPDEIDLNSLTLGTIHDPDGFGMGHIPIPEHDFLSWQPKLLVQTEVKEDELEGYKIYKENNGIPFYF